MHTFMLKSGAAAPSCLAAAPSCCLLLSCCSMLLSCNSVMLAAAQLQLCHAACCSAAAPCCTCAHAHVCFIKRPQQTKDMNTTTYRFSAHLPAHAHAHVGDIDQKPHAEVDSAGDGPGGQRKERRRIAKRRQCHGCLQAWPHEALSIASDCQVWETHHMAQPVAWASTLPVLLRVCIPP